MLKSRKSQVVSYHFSHQIEWIFLKIQDKLLQIDHKIKRTPTDKRERERLEAIAIGSCHAECSPISNWDRNRMTWYKLATPGVTIRPQKMSHNFYIFPNIFGLWDRYHSNDCDCIKFPKTEFFLFFHATSY